MKTSPSKMEGGTPSLSPTLELGKPSYVKTLVRIYRWRIVVTLALMIMLLRTWPSGESAGSHEMKACPSNTTDLNGFHKGRGIVITVSSQKRQDMDITLANLKVIREVFKNSIPVELWYHGPDEAYPPEFLRELCQLGGVRVRDIARYGHCKKYYCKIWAAQYSSFDKILILDSNSLVFQNPNVIFGMLESTDKDAVYLFRDYVHCFHSMSKLWVENWLGVNSDDFCENAHMDEIDSSCVVIDKTRGGEDSILETYKLAHYFLKSSWLLGDKDMWLLAAMRTGTKRTVHAKAPAFFTYTNDDGSVRPFEGHVHLDDANLPLYANFQMISLCTMATDRLKYFANADNDTDERYLPYCEGRLTESATKTLMPASSHVLSVMNKACQSIQDYRHALGESAFIADTARSCPWTCGARTLPQVFTCS